MGLNLTSLIDAITPIADAATKQAADLESIASDQASDLCDTVLSFHKVGNMVSFSLD